MLTKERKRKYMKGQMSKKKLWVILLIGMLGCVLMAAGDYLMIYGDTAYTGKLAWLTEGVKTISPQRNTWAMVLAFPAVILYSFALLAVGYMMKEERHKRVYKALTVWGMTPWLCLHLFYVMILYLFGWLWGNGQGELAYQACEAVFAHFSWLVMAAQVLMILPFIYWFYQVLRGRTRLPKGMCLNNPLIIYVILKVLTMVLPDSPFRLAFVNGLMSESMFIWFLILMFAPRREE